MAFTKVTNAGIGSTNTVLLHNLNVVGTVTATDGIFSGIGSFGGNVSVGGVLTYEDVTNVDSVGLITARKGISVLGAGVTIAGGGLNVNAGVSTFGGNVKVGSGITLSPDGDVYVTGVSTFSAVSGTTGTFSGNITANGNIVGDNSTDISGINDVTVSMLSISDTITHTGDTNTKIRFPAADTFAVETAGSESLRVDSSQRLLVGTTSSRSAAAGEHRIQIESNGTNGLSLTRATADAGAINISFIKTRNGAIVQSGDDCGAINWFGDDGTDTNSYIARIQGMSDGTPGSNDMPGRLVFSTTSDGDHTTDERMRISANGRVSIGNATNNGNPTSLFGVKAADGEAADLYVGQFDNLESTAGQSYGVLIKAGSNSTDHGLRVRNRANDTTLFEVRGDGAILDSKGNLRDIPLNTNTASRTLTSADFGKVIATNNTGWVIPNDAAFTAGKVITLLNDHSGGLTIDASALVLLYNTADGNNIKSNTLTLGARGIATLYFWSQNACYIQASSLTVS